MTAEVATPNNIVRTVVTRVSVGLPTKLEIPIINISADILQMGLTEAGDMEAPIKGADTGWYKYGPNPGNEGSAVIAGHVGVTEPNVFTNLSKLQVGDQVFVTDNTGLVITFIVRRTQVYDPAQQQHDEVFKSSSGTHLNLVTCAGDWDEQKQRYSDRLVVFTERLI